MPEHLFDDRTQLHHTDAIWHKDPKLELFIRQLIEEVKPDRWVETGSHMGWTSMWIAKNYPNLPLFTVEVDPGFYAKAKDNLEPYPQVHITLGSSPDFLRDLTPELKKGMSMFWLDAHWWPPVPLRQECEIVSKLEKYVCLIDDFSCWKPDFSGDTFFSIAPSGGDAYLNDISYVCEHMGRDYYRPNWVPLPSSKGVGVFVKGIGYSPSAEFVKYENLDIFIETRGRSNFERANEPGFVSYPIHPSCGRNLL